MKQQIVHLIPRGVRRLLWRLHGYWEYKGGVLLGSRDPLIPPLTLHSVGGGDFDAIGEEFFRFFVDLCGLRPQDRVLDVGCGTGRMAKPLSRYLTSGSYEGVDVVAPSVKWCRKAYSSRCPSFRFQVADVYNKVYNPTGRTKPADYRFPFDDSSFDFVFLTSVFTHMLPREVEHYLGEVGRVLKSNGRSLITYFLLNDDSWKRIQERASGYRFRYELDGCCVEDGDTPEHAVAYEEAVVRALYGKCGLAIDEPIHYGRWCKREQGASFQDMIVASKPR